MISGVVAQEYIPLPHGVLAPQRLDADDVFFSAVIVSGLNQYLLAVTVFDPDEEAFTTDLPHVLTSDAIFDLWSGDAEYVFTPRVTQDRRLLVDLYHDYETIFAPDLRIPDFLLPQFMASDDHIFATGTILDPGMWRTELYHDNDFIFSPIIDAADTLFPPLLAMAEVIFQSSIRGGVISPPFLIGDDQFFAFSTITRMQPALFVDSGKIVQPATSWDGVNDGVTISSDGLTAALTAPRNYCGARTSISRNSGKCYWEITVGPMASSSGQAGIIKETATFTQMTQASILNESLGVILNASVFDARIDPNAYYGATVVGNGHWYCHFGYAMNGQNFGYGAMLRLNEGDVIGIAINLDSRLAWFRLNAGPWNNDMYGDTALPNQSPVTGVGGIPLPYGKMGPAVTLGGSAGTSQSGNSGDNFTANFGAKAYRAPPPAGFINVEPISPFGQSSNGDSFGPASIAIPASLNDGAAFVTMSNGFLTATHNTASDFGGAQSASSQRSGRYYFEVTVGVTHGRSDSVGILIDSLLGGAPEGTLHKLAQGSGCAAVYFLDGAIWSLGSSTGKALGAIVAGDVIGIAVNLDEQTNTSGGTVWFRKRTGGVTSNWNGATFAEDADPVTGKGAINLTGFAYSRTWVPVVGFSGSGTSVGDTMTANLGAAASVMPRPAGYSPWPTAFDNSIQVLTANTVVHDDSFQVPVVDLGNKQLQPQAVFVDPEAIFPTKSTGGNLLLIASLVPGDDLFYAPGYFPRFDVADPQVTLSNNNFTATVNTALAYTGAKSNAYQIVGKFYVEFTWMGSHGSQDAVGFIADGVPVKSLFDGVNCISYTGNSGISYSNNANLGVLMGTPQSGDVVSFAVNLDIRRVWIRLNNGTWNNNASADPVSGTGGFNIQALLSFAPAVEFNSPAGNAYTINFGATTELVFARPAGYGIWPGNSMSQPPLRPGLVADFAETIFAARTNPVYLAAALVPSDDAMYLVSGSGGSLTIGPQGAVRDDLVESIFAPSVGFQLATLDGPTSNVTLSLGKLVATHDNTTGDSGARSTAYKNQGKWYFEVALTNIHGNFDCAGILLSTASYANFVSQSINCVSTFKSSGNIWGNNAYSGKTLGALVIGDVISIAIDMTARKAWLRKNGGNWNGLALSSENPNTGAGGVTIGAGAFGPAVGFGGSGTAANDAMLTNFGQSGFSFPAPTAFVPWTSIPEIPYILTAPLIPSDDIVFPWTPSLLLALKAWYRGDKLTGADGSLVSSFPDSSGLGNNAGGGNSPILQVAERNGLNVVQWGVNSAFMTMPNIFAGATSGSVVMALIATSTGGTPLRVGTDSSITPAYPDGTGHVVSDFASTSAKTTGVIANLSSWHIASFHSSAGLWKYFKDSVEQFSTATNAVAFQTSPQLGRFTGLSAFFPGMIAEFIFTNDDMSDADRQRCEGYLAHKWALTGSLPAGHPYKTVPP